MFVAVLAVTGLALAGYSAGLARGALWQVVRACVADWSRFQSPFPCLAVADDAVVLRPPLLDDTVLAPTRPVSGVEDPFLLTPDAPNYFAAAWRARRFLARPGAAAPPADEVGLVVNSAVVRSQDQLHIHIGCLRPDVRNALIANFAQVPRGAWEKLPTLVPHIAFWGMRIPADRLQDISPFRLAADALAGQLRDRSLLTIGVAGLNVGETHDLLIFASYAGAPHSWWPVGAESLLGSCGKNERIF